MVTWQYQVAVSSCVQNQAPSYLIDCCGMSPVSLVTITCSQHVLPVHSSFLSSESFHLLLSTLDCAIQLFVVTRTVRMHTMRQRLALFTSVTQQVYISSVWRQMT